MTSTEVSETVKGINGINLNSSNGCEMGATNGLPGRAKGVFESLHKFFGSENVVPENVEGQKVTATTGTATDAQLIMQGPFHGFQGLVTPEQLKEAKGKLTKLMEATGQKLPQRSYMDDPDIKWRFGRKPDYTLADLAFLEGKTKNHAENSLELIVENIVKTWEFERSHKKLLSQHQSVHESFSLKANNGRRLSNEEVHEVGNYNALLNGADPNLYDAANATWEESHEAFGKAFATFPWEVLEVYCGPPKVAFSWRHWGHFTGSYKSNRGQGQLIEVIGFMTAEVTEDLKLKSSETFFDANKFLSALEGNASG